VESKYSHRSVFTQKGTNTRAKLKESWQETPQRYGLVAQSKLVVASSFGAVVNSV
jgi:hypothetical protein